MSFRTRILLACVTAALVPLVVLAAGARHVVRERLTEQYAARAAESGAAVRAALRGTARDIDVRLLTLEHQLTDDPALRAALLDAGDRAALLDYASSAMTTMRLDYLLLLDGAGVVLSSGHFRNDYGSVLEALPTIERADDPVLVGARRPEGEFLALVNARTFELGTRELALVGGMRVDSAFIARLGGRSAEDASVVLDTVAAARPADETRDAIVESITLPFVREDAVTAVAARLRIAHSLEPLRAVVRALDLWFLAAAAAALLLAYIIARILAARVNRPLEELARRARQVELARYDVQLATPRRDEVGSLSRMLDRMVQRLRAAALQLRDAERRATIGDMARQVNHDIRNGLLPIRNVIAHLTEVARDSPTELGAVFAEREGTLQGGIGYLEKLATNYARLSPRIEREACNVNVVLDRVLRESAAAADDRVSLEAGENLPRVPADPLALRRVVENLVINAIESLGEQGGAVVVRSGLDGDAGERRVVIAVSDTGAGMPAETVEHVFDDFFTTKERGTGLGLSIVRRLVTDMGGRIRVHSEPGRGTTFTIELAAAP